MKDVSKDRADAMKKILHHAQEDPDFRTRLLASPRETVQNILGIQIPEDVQFHVLEETSTRRYLVLPEMKEAGERELSDEDLDVAAGGQSEDWGSGNEGPDWGGSGGG